MSRTEVEAALAEWRRAQRELEAMAAESDGWAEARAAVEAARSRYEQATRRAPGNEKPRA
jgi:hypothetical protein